MRVARRPNYRTYPRAGCTYYSANSACMTLAPGIIEVIEVYVVIFLDDVTDGGTQGGCADILPQTLFTVWVHYMMPARLA